jgi:hypothetical protein
MNFAVGISSVPILLNFRDEESIRVLVRAKLLKPLGNPPEGAPMRFAMAYILQLSQDAKWLAKANTVLQENFPR